MWVFVCGSVWACGCGCGIGMEIRYQDRAHIALVVSIASLSVAACQWRCHSHCLFTQSSLTATATVHYSWPSDSRLQQPCTSGRSCSLSAPGPSATTAPWCCHCHCLFRVTPSGITPPELPVIAGSAALCWWQ